MEGGLRVDEGFGDKGCTFPVNVEARPNGVIRVNNRKVGLL